MKERIKWYFKQLLPLMYVSEHGQAACTCDSEKGEGCTDCGKYKPVVTIWRMWFGRCFNIRTWEVARQANNIG